jgi:hypothetical protein
MQARTFLTQLRAEEFYGDGQWYPQKAHRQCRE